jgi:hypothetical protein
MTNLNFPEGAWQSLFIKAMDLLDQIHASGITVPKWSLGGGTVLMFHYQHRLSKDIDIFIPDPQFLPYINPTLSSITESFTHEYTGNHDSIKLLFKEGEIDFIATLPLTKEPYIQCDVLGHMIWLETPLEITAKKMWHRGSIATARDLFDLATVINHSEADLKAYPEIFLKNSDVFLKQCHERKFVLEKQFDQIVKINNHISYDECLKVAEQFFRQL